MYGEARAPYHLSVGSAPKLSYMKALPKLSYGMDRLWTHLTAENSETVEKCFFTYLKGVFRAPRIYRNRFPYVSARIELPLTGTMRTVLTRSLSSLTQTDFFETAAAAAAAAVIPEVGTLQACDR